MDSRKNFVGKHLDNRKARILELGPLNRPIVDKTIYPNCRYCDIRSTQEVKDLYSGNTYLKQTGIQVDTETIVEIDDVISGTYSKFYERAEPFDAVIASHVLEHMGDLIFSLQDIGKILKPGGIFCIVYPDMRYCFDHFRQSASFRDAYNVYRNGVVRNSPMVLDFFLTSVTENNPTRFWKNENLEALLPKGKTDDAVRAYEDAENGIQSDDVHYWPFTDWDFLLFLYQCTRMRLLPFKCTDFMATEENDQQFMVTLKQDETVMSSPEEALDSLLYWMRQALPRFYTSRDKQLPLIVDQQAEEIEQLHNAKSIVEEEVHRLQIENTKLVAAVQTADSKVRDDYERIKAMGSRIAELETIERSRIWRMTKPLRSLLDAMKRIISSERKD